MVALFQSLTECEGRGAVIGSMTVEAVAARAKSDIDGLSGISLLCLFQQLLGIGIEELVVGSRRCR